MAAVVRNSRVWKLRLFFIGEELEALFKSYAA